MNGDAEAREGAHSNGASSRATAASQQRTDRRRKPVLTEPITVDRFWRNRAGQAVVTTLSEFEGRLLLDLRIYYTDKSGCLKPTPKGLAVSVNRLPELAAAIRKAQARAVELGLLEATESSS